VPLAPCDALAVYCVMHAAAGTRVILSTTDMVLPPAALRRAPRGAQGVHPTTVPGNRPV
jgi:hypothetical protein